jgi:hypothetical protein
VHFCVVVQKEETCQRCHNLSTFSVGTSQPSGSGARNQSFGTKLNVLRREAPGRPKGSGRRVADCNISRPQRFRIFGREKLKRRNGCDDYSTSRAESENRRVTGSCINWIFAVKPKLENYHEHQSPISTIEDRRMTTEFPLSHLFSDLAKSLQELAKKFGAEIWLPRLNDLLDKLEQISKRSRMSLSY